MSDYCESKQNCTLDNKTKKDIGNAISLIGNALGYFENNGKYLKSKKGLNFYDNLTSAVNNIYTYSSDPNFGSDIDGVLDLLILASYKIATTARDEAVLTINDGECSESNCEELLKNANSEIGKAIDDSKQDNYVFIFNHLTNAWKFSMNIMGENLRKDAGEVAKNLPIPTEYGLDQNYPNPFNPSTRIDYRLPENNYVSLAVYDILGNLVTTLVNQEMEAGYHSVNWNAVGFSSGIYFYRIHSGSYVSTKKLILLK